MNSDKQSNKCKKERKKKTKEKKNKDGLRSLH